MKVSLAIKERLYKIIQLQGEWFICEGESLINDSVVKEGKQ